MHTLKGCGLNVGGHAKPGNKREMHCKTMSNYGLGQIQR
jgi:hypothetical protein